VAGHTVPLFSVYGPFAAETAETVRTAEVGESQVVDVAGTDPIIQCEFIRMIRT